MVEAMYVPIYSIKVLHQINIEATKSFYHGLSREEDIERTQRRIVRKRLGLNLKFMFRKTQRRKRVLLNREAAILTRFNARVPQWTDRTFKIFIYHRAVA